MKKIRIILLLVSLAVFTSCNMERKTSADEKQAEQTAQALLEANNQIGMPAIINFQQKKDFKEILEILDQESIITYTYLASSYDGKIGQFLGKSVGYGIPAATQFTNPVKLVQGDRGQYTGDIAVPQADPNGLFMPTATSATWIKLIDPDGKPRVVFVEPLIIISPFKLH